MVLDLSNIEIDEKDYIQEEGTYALKIIDIKEDKAQSGANMLTVEFVTKDNLYFNSNFTISENSMGIIKRFFEYAGVDTSKKFDPREANGHYIKAKLENRMYNGKNYLNATKWIKSGIEQKIENDVNKDGIPF